MFVDLITGARINHKKLADPLVSKTVDIAIVEGSKLGTTVTRANAGNPPWIPAITRQRARPPSRDVWLTFVQRVASNDHEPIVLLDQGVGIGQAGNQIKSLRQNIRAHVGDLSALCRNVSDILDPSDRLVTRRGIDN